MSQVSPLCRGLILTILVFGSSAGWACHSGPAAMEFDDPSASRAVSITLFPNNIFFDEPGESFQFTARVNDQLGYAVVGARVNWETSDRAVMTVDSAGWVTAVAKGNGTITVIYEGVSAKADVVVH